MATKIDITDADESDEDPKLIKKVDSMMDPSLKDQPEEPVSVPVQVNKASDDLPPLDIYSEPLGAPPLKKSSKKSELNTEPTETAATTKKKDTVAPTPVKTEVETTPFTTAQAPDEFNDPATVKAINEIVAEESDVVLRAEDNAHASEQPDAPAEPEREGHPFFWTLVVIVCLIAIFLAVYIYDPNLHNPLSKINWSRIKRHL